MSEDFLRQWAPIAISLLSFVVAGIALGWNVYRDVVLKARVRVHFAVVRVVNFGQRAKEGEQYLKIGVTNHGPGPVRINMIVGQYAPPWRRLFRRVKHFVIIHDHANPLNPKLPHRLEVGDSISLLLPYDEKGFLGGGGTHIGVSDSFGRSHFAPRDNVDEARRQFAKDFPTTLRRSDP